ncbi:MAG: GNAT family N-acetyltransferase [Leptolinea sp.]
MPEVEIRPASVSDLPLLSNLERHYQTNRVWQMERSVTDEQVRIQFREISLPRSIRVEYPHQPNLVHGDHREYAVLLTAILNNTPVGYIAIWEQLASGAAWIRDLVVREKNRRQGIASGLILAGQDWASRKRYKRMIIEMQSKNYPGFQMVKKLGFEFCGYHDNYFDNQDIAIMFSKPIKTMIA